MPLCLDKFIQQTKEQFSNVVSSHPDPIPFLLSVKHLHKQLFLLKGSGSNLANSQFGAAALRARSVT